MWISQILHTMFLLLLSVSKISCYKWEDPYFIDANTDGVELQSPTSIIQPLNVTEEIPWPFDLVLINYDGNIPPYIEDFTNMAFLNATVERKDGKWVIVVNNRQDYENPNQRVYLFNVILKVESVVEQHKVRVGLFNIFDNNPSVSYEPIPCRTEVRYFMIYFFRLKFEMKYFVILM